MFSINNLEYSDLLIFSVLISITMYWFLSRQKEHRSHSTKLFQRFIASLIPVGIFEVLSWIIAVPGNSELIPYHYLINALFFSFNLLPASLGLCYLDYIITFSKERNSRRTYVYLIPVYVNVAFIVVNLFSDGFLFSVDSNDVYHRGIATYIGNAFTLLFAVVVIIRFYRNRQMITGRITQVVLVLTLLPVAGMVLQMMFFGLSLAVPAYVLAAFATFLLMERHELQKDPLTLLHSRAQLETRLQFKLRSQEPFTAIMIDVNGFKKINDVYGHTIGDQVLKDVSKVLLTNANYEDFVCRFGGDEFFVILESPLNIGQNYIKRIEQNLLNYSNGRPFSTALSFGLVYVDDTARYEVEELVHITDQLMYMDKTKRKQ
jgi:diguanylate cyclase (GGDEF)-like protein